MSTEARATAAAAGGTSPPRSTTPAVRDGLPARVVGVLDTTPQTDGTGMEDTGFDSLREFSGDADGGDLADVDLADADERDSIGVPDGATSGPAGQTKGEADADADAPPPPSDVRASPPSGGGSADGSGVASDGPAAPAVRSRRQGPPPGGDGGAQIATYGGGGSPEQIRRSCLKRKKSRGSEPPQPPRGPPFGGVGGGGAAHSSGDESAHHPDGAPQGGGPVRCGRARRLCRSSTRDILRTTVSVMNFLSRILLWGTLLSTAVGVVWYSRELSTNGKEPHLVAWFSAGAFVLLGFPISMCGIIMHLKNYYQPNVQCYVVRILWMVPIYSVESWLCLRFHTLAIYIETLRDFYESYVLYSFFQFLIEVLGGEESLVLMLKDKSPTRGAHIWGLGYCVKPWLMGQPVSRRMTYQQSQKDGMNGAPPPSPGRPVQRVVRWKSPFFLKCKFGVLQYVLLKFVSAILVMLLEMKGLYKEGDFTPRGGYLYICILTNLSQCWALYCLVFFYYALKNELGPIRPVGKFLSVKALVFFTWWQSLGIAVLSMMGMIPHYTSFTEGKEWTSEAVAKGLQDWLICIEMFVAAIVHTFVFPHTDYLEPLGIMKQRDGLAVHGTSRRLGRRGRYGHHHPGRRGGDDRSTGSKGSGGDAGGGGNDHPSDVEMCQTEPLIERADESDAESVRSDAAGGARQQHERKGFVSALLDSAVPRDVLDESVGIFKGRFHDEKKTLLHHAATSDEYDLFSKRRKRVLRLPGRSGLARVRERDEGVAVAVPNSIL